MKGFKEATSLTASEPIHFDVTCQKSLERLLVAAIFHDVGIGAMRAKNEGL